MKLIQKWLDYLVGRKKSRLERNNDLHTIYRSITIFISVFSIFMLAAVLVFFDKNRSFAFLNVLTITSVYYFGGCALGFIFAIPKSAQGNQVVKVVSQDGTPTAAPASDYYRDNTNLEEISDWLTKIIVGLSLTQFGHLQDMVRDAAKHIADVLGKANGAGRGSSVDFFVFAYAVILLYAIAGLIIGYLWTRIDFPKILTQAREELKKIQTLEDRNRNLLQLINDPNSNLVNTTEIQHRYEFHDPPLLQLLERISNNKTVLDSTDPQKGRWGGLALVNDKQLAAEVTSSKIPGLYKVRILVRCTGDAGFASPVAILLHPTFVPTIRLLEAKGSKEVSLEIVSYEAFTVAAVMDLQSETSYTSLELDLNELPGLPGGFYWE